MAACLSAGGTGFGHLVNMASARVLCYKDPIFFTLKIVSNFWEVL